MKTQNLPGSMIDIRSLRGRVGKIGKDVSVYAPVCTCTSVSVCVCPRHRDKPISVVLNPGCTLETLREHLNDTEASDSFPLSFHLSGAGPKHQYIF